jgi:isopropylmalate/homocitrate/citramalate synthase
MRLPPRVTVVEVGPRDGLQNESISLAVADKVAFIERLAGAGLPVIEVGAFVSPKWVPSMANTDAVVSALSRRPGVRYAALVPNLIGIERAAAAGITDIALFGATSETFSRRNINQSIADSFATFQAVMPRALALGMRVRGYLSTCFGCPYEGDIPPARVVELTRALLDLGVVEVAVSDTIGVATPGQIWRVLDVLALSVPVGSIALHLHDTRGAALANVLAGIDAGVTTFDASCGGLGGCPYAPGATGNLATEDLVNMLHGLGIDTGVDLETLLGASSFIAERLGTRLPSRYYQAWRATAGRGEAW